MDTDFLKDVKQKNGDDSGMQTRVWGPAGWLFLHSIAQNYPWNPTPDQKKEYYEFFRLVGKVLPCRYCRESYQEFIKEDGTCLDMSVMASRKTLTYWLFKIHDRINKKLDIKEHTTFKQVWDKYESFRSKCTKSPEVKEKIKKGCLDPMSGLRQSCKIKFVKVDAKGQPLKKSSFGKGKGTIKLISIKKSNKSGKKLMATFERNGRKKVIHFGARGMSDFTKHKDRARRQRYFSRHRKDLRTGDPSRAGYLSMFVLWNKPSLKASISDYRRRLGVYNRTGKFPKKI
jgi:hypothetical protein